MVSGRRCWINVILLVIAFCNVWAAANEANRRVANECEDQADTTVQLQVLLQPPSVRYFIGGGKSSSEDAGRLLDADTLIGSGVGWGITSFVALVGLSISVVAFTVSGWLFPLLSVRVVSYAVCGIYVGLSVSIDLIIASQKTKNGKRMYAFNPVCTVALAEAVKFVVSGVLVLTRKFSTGQPILPPEFAASDIAWFFLPATLFTMNNILVFVALGSNDAAAFGIFRDTIIVWTAIMWWWVFRVNLGPTRLGGIAILFFGLIVNRVAHLLYAQQAWSWAFLLVLLMALTNATGSVANEFALKRSVQLDLNLQNVILYAMCMTFSLLVLAIADSPRLLGGPSSFFNGFSASTLLMVGLQALAGLLVSRLLKYADSVTKSVATCLRGPLFVIISPAFVSSPLDAGTIVSAATVAVGCCIYLIQGPLSTSPPKVSEHQAEGSLQNPMKPPLGTEEGDKV